MSCNCQGKKIFFINVTFYLIKKTLHLSPLVTVDQTVAAGVKRVHAVVLIGPTAVTGGSGGRSLQDRHGVREDDSLNI